MQQCDEEKLLGHLGVVLYEYLGEEYPEVLGSILSALKSIVNVIGMTKMTPPIKDLLPRLTPILKNRSALPKPHRPHRCPSTVGKILLPMLKVSSCNQPFDGLTDVMQYLMPLIARHPPLAI